MNMIHPMRHFVSRALLSIACSLALVTTLHSQTDDIAFEPAEGKLAVTVVLAEGHGAPLIFRRATEPRNVIVINQSTNARQLSAALFSLIVTEARDPAGQERVDNAALRITMPGSTPEFGNTARVISSLHTARARRIGSFGSEQRAIEIWVAPRRGRHQ